MDKDAAEASLTRRLCETVFLIGLENPHDIILSLDALPTTHSLWVTRANAMKSTSWPISRKTHGSSSEIYTVLVYRRVISIVIMSFSYGHVHKMSVQLSCEMTIKVIGANDFGVCSTETIFETSFKLTPRSGMAGESDVWRTKRINIFCSNECESSTYAVILCLDFEGCSFIARVSAGIVIRKCQCVIHFYLLISIRWAWLDRSGQLSTRSSLLFNGLILFLGCPI